MGTGIITGNKAVQEQPLHWGRADSGNFAHRRFESTDKLFITRLTAAFSQIPGLLYEVTEQFGKSILEVHVPYGPYGIDPRTDKIENWELYSNTSEADVLAAKTNTGITDNLTDRQVSKIRLLSPPNVPDPDDPAYPTGAGDFTFADEPSSGDTADNAYLVWLRMKKGILNYPVEQPEIRHTITTSLSYTVPASLENVRKILTTNFMIKVEGLPEGLLFDPPDSAQDPASADPNLVYGFYKHFPTIQGIALGKWNIVQEYRYGLWDTTFYGKAIDAP